MNKPSNGAKSIMILGAGEAQIPVIIESKKLNLFTIVVDIDESAPGFQFADINLLISTIDEIKIYNAAKKYKIDGIITTSDYPVRSVAYICEKLNLIGLNVRASKISTNKYLLRKCLHDNKILTPNFLKISNVEELKRVNCRYNYPLIIKPVDSSASRGVKKIRDPAELKAAYYESVKYSKCGDVIIEEFLTGTEYSIEVLCFRGEIHIIAITEKTTLGFENSFFVEDRHIIPANVDAEDKKQIEFTIFKVIKTIGLDNCAVHAEIILTIRGPIIVEVGARLGGDYITSDLVPLSTGINMHEKAINICLNNNIQIETSKHKFSGIQFVNSQNYYSVKKHLEKIKTKNGFIRSELKDYKNINLKNSMDRLGYYICVGKNRETLEHLLDWDGNNKTI